MGFAEAAKITDIAEGGLKEFTVAGKQILVVGYQGNYYAMGARCTHMGGELARGKLEGKVVTCPRHGARFDVTTGECISGPKIGPVKLKANDEPAYQVKVEGGIIKVNL